MYVCDILYTFYFKRRDASAFACFVLGHALDYSTVFDVRFGNGEYLTIATGRHQERFSAHRLIVEKPTDL